MMYTYILTVDRDVEPLALSLLSMHTHIHTLVVVVIHPVLFLRLCMVQFASPRTPHIDR